MMMFELLGYTGMQRIVVQTSLELGWFSFYGKTGCDWFRKWASTMLSKGLGMNVYVATLANPLAVKIGAKYDLDDFTRVDVIFCTAR